MPKPEKYSLIGMYGRKDIFEKRLREGYTRVAFGSGNWVNSQRIVSLWVFYHPDGGIATYEHPKFYDGSYTFRGQPFEEEYNKEGFQKHLKRFQIKLGEKYNLSELVKNWE